MAKKFLLILLILIFTTTALAQTVGELIDEYIRYWDLREARREELNALGTGYLKDRLYIKLTTRILSVRQSILTALETVPADEAREQLERIRSFAAREAISREISCRPGLFDKLKDILMANLKNLIGIRDGGIDPETGQPFDIDTRALYRERIIRLEQVLINGFRAQGLSELKIADIFERAGLSVTDLGRIGRLLNPTVGLNLIRKAIAELEPLMRCAEFREDLTREEKSKFMGELNHFKRDLVKIEARLRKPGTGGKGAIFGFCADVFLVGLHCSAQSHLEKLLTELQRQSDKIEEEMEVIIDRLIEYLVGIWGEEYRDEVENKRQILAFILRNPATVTKNLGINFPNHALTASQRFEVLNHYSGSYIRKVQERQKLQDEITRITIELQDYEEQCLLI